HIIDSLSACVGLRLLVEYAVKLRNEGQSIETIVSILEDARSRIVLLAMVDTLEYLHKGGRLSKGSAVMGTLLKIKPVVTLNDGALEMLTKARGTKNAINVLFDELAKSGTLDKNVPVYLGYTRDKQQSMEFKERGHDSYNLPNINIHPVGCVIGTHTGPGAVILVYLKEKQ
ncbi:MAG: DegV family protein, partial [Eubacterium sp.]